MQPLLGGAEVLLRVHRPQHRVLGDALVEAVHEAPEGLLAADLLVEGLLLKRAARNLFHPSMVSDRCRTQGFRAPPGATWPAQGADSPRGPCRRTVEDGRAALDHDRGHARGRAAWRGRRWCGEIVAERLGSTDPAWRAAFAEVPRHLFVPYYYVGAVAAAPSGVWGEDPDPRRRGALAARRLRRRAAGHPGARRRAGLLQQPAVADGADAGRRWRSRRATGAGDRRGHRLQRGTARAPARRPSGDHRRPRPGDHRVGPRAPGRRRIPRRPSVTA